MGYYEHIEANTFHSLLPRYLGLYKIKLPNRPVERLVVMNNLFHVPGPEPRPKIMQKFDLKGSLLKRYAALCAAMYAALYAATTVTHSSALTPHLSPLTSRPPSLTPHPRLGT